MKLGLTPKLHEACSPELVGRYAMDAILGERTGDVMRLVATNGRIVAVVEREAHEDDVSGLIPAAAWKAACKAKPAGTPGRTRSHRRGDPEHHAIVANGSVRVLDGSTVTEFPRPKAGEFPPSWQQVIPKAGQGTVRVSLNPRLLLELAEACGMGRGSECVTLEIQPDIKSKKNALICAAIRVETAGGYGAIMPITID